MNVRRAIIVRAVDLALREQRARALGASSRLVPRIRDAVFDLQVEAMLRDPSVSGLVEREVFSRPDVAVIAR